MSVYFVVVILYREYIKGFNYPVKIIKTTLVTHMHHTVTHITHADIHTHTAVISKIAMSDQLDDYLDIHLLVNQLMTSLTSVIYN